MHEGCKLSERDGSDGHFLGKKDCTTGKKTQFPDHLLISLSESFARTIDNLRYCGNMPYTLHVYQSDYPSLFGLSRLSFAL